MIWGMTLEPGKLYTEVIGDEVHLSMASLESRKDFAPEGEKPEGTCHIIMKTEKSEYLLCTLANGVIYQQSLDLKLMPREKVTFSVQGSNMVYLTGYSTSYPDMEDHYEGLSDTGEWEPYDTGGNVTLDSADISESADLEEEGTERHPVNVYVKSEDEARTDQPPTDEALEGVQMEHQHVIPVTTPERQPLNELKPEPIEQSDQNELIFSIADIGTKQEPQGEQSGDVTLVVNDDDDERQRELTQQQQQQQQVHEQQLQELQSQLQQHPAMLQQQQPQPLESDQFLHQMSMMQQGVPPTRARGSPLRRARGRPTRAHRRGRGARQPQPQTFQQNLPAGSSFPSMAIPQGYQGAATTVQQDITHGPLPAAQNQAMLSQAGSSRHAGPGPSTSSISDPNAAPKSRPATDCPICGKTFSNTYRCNRHLLSHSQLRPFKCSACDKAFYRKDKLLAHQRIHTRTHKFYCEKCGRGYSWKYDKIRHEKCCQGH